MDDNLAGEDNLARRIKSERERRGWSAYKLAQMMAAEGCEVPKNAIPRIEQGQRSISFDEALALARVFELSMDDFATALPVLESVRSRAAISRARDRAVSLFGATNELAVALDEYLSILDQFGRDDPQVTTLLELLARTVRNISPDPVTDPDGAVLDAAIDHLQRVMEIVTLRRNSTDLLRIVQDAGALARFFPAWQQRAAEGWVEHGSGPTEGKSAGEYEALVAFAEADPEGFADLAQQDLEDAREIQALWAGPGEVADDGER